MRYPNKKKKAVPLKRPPVIRDYYIAEESGGEISDILWYDDEYDDFSELFKSKDALQDGRLLFEHLLWQYKRVDSIATRTESPYDDLAELPYLALNYEIGLLEGLSEYYQSHSVNDDDLDVIQDIVMHAVDDLDLYDGTTEYLLLRYVFEKALSVLQERHVFIDEETGSVMKTMEEVIDAFRRNGLCCRDWEQIGVSEDEVRNLVDVIQNDRPDKFDDFLLCERLYRAVEKLRPQEKRVIELRYGLGNEKNLTLEDAGKILNLTRERIRQIEKMAIRRLRHIFNIETEEDDEVPKRKGEEETERKVIAPKVQPRVLQSRVTLDTVEMSILDWLQTIGSSAEEMVSYMKSCGQKISWAPKRFKEAMVSYINRVAIESLREPSEILSLVGQGYSLKQALAGEGAIPDNALAVTLEIDGYLYTVDEWVNDTSVSESTRRHRHRALFGNGKFNPQAMVSKIMAENHKKAVDKQRRKEERENQVLIWNGEEKRVREWAKTTGIPLQVILIRLSSKWAIDEILTIPYPHGRIIEFKGRRFTDEMFLKEYKMPYDKWIDIWLDKKMKSASKKRSLKSKKRARHERR